MKLNEYLNESIENTKRIFVVIKPGFLNLSQSIIEKYKKHGWNVERMITKQLIPTEAKKLYAVHKEEDFYKDLCEYMSSDKTTGIIFKKISKLNTDAFKEAGILKDEIRKEWGESDMRNVVHSSDSLEHMKEESSIYFNILGLF
jgi:nucleoside-diphosphate kinase